MQPASTSQPGSLPQRFVASTSARDRITAALEYVGRLGPDQISWLYQKPIREAGAAEQFTELYSVLNAIQLMGLEPGNTVLEVGSGPGWVTELFVRLDVNVTCIEPASNMVAIARERVDATLKHHRITKPPHVEYIQSSLEAAALSERAFDAILFHESLHHIIDESAGVRQAFRALRPGGTMVVCEWCWIPGNATLEATLQEEMEKYGTLESPYTQKYLEEILRDAGFTDICRYHSINGFIPETQGERSVVSVAQAPAGQTNNLSAIRPFDTPTSRQGHAVDREKIRLHVSGVEWSRGRPVVQVHLRLTNDSDAVLLNTGVGRVTVSLCTGTLGQAGFVEAGRVNIPKMVRPGSSIEFSPTYEIPAGAEAEAWRLELVAEDVEWLDLVSKPAISRRSAVDPACGP